jgi:hypothetical protein
VLVGLPIIVLLFLLQSYFWVPTYEEQTKGNPERLEEYVTASIGDAQLLNPALSADSASSDINGLVFEGLLDYDENLNFRPRLATSWEIHEEAYFYVNDRAETPTLRQADARGLVRLIIQARQENSDLTDSLSKSLSNIETIEILPAHQFMEEITESTPDGKKVKVRIRISAPPRIKLILKRVDQDIFDNLEKLLGTSYFTSFQAERFVGVEPAEFGSKKKEYAKILLPAVEHNPVILFTLRPGVKFHDGHVFDGYDVKFTYDAIMDAANVSPRLPDYEPVKRVEVLNPLTVRIVYKRLYSPALGTWMMGVLPEHLLDSEALRDEARRGGLNSETISVRQSEFNREPIGCGPFRFREWKSDQYILLDRFDDYWEGPPNYLSYRSRHVDPGNGILCWNRRQLRGPAPPSSPPQK